MIKIGIEASYLYCSNCDEAKCSALTVAKVDQ